MKRIVKNFNDFSYIKENLEDKIESESSLGEVEESPLSQVGDEIGLSVNKDDKGDFLKTENGDIIRYYSETGFYNETKKKKYGEDISELINSIQSKTEESEPVRESRSCKTKSCRNNCRCKR
jgi:hypothetical protein